MANLSPAPLPFIALMFLLILFGPIGYADIAEAADRKFTEEQIAQIEKRMAETQERLNLTDTQKEQIQPILRDSLEKRMAVLKSYGFSEGTRPTLNFREKIALGKEMRAIRDDITRQVAGILDETQMAEFEKIQEERREQMRERLQAKKG